MSILAAVDTSDASRTALRHAAREARLRDVPMTILYCLERESRGETWWHWLAGESSDPDVLRQRTRERLDAFVDEALAESHRPESWTIQIRESKPSDGIEAMLEESDHELAVLGATGSNRLEQFLLGSTTQHVVQNSPVPVLVVPKEASPHPYERILAPIDFSECARLGLQRAGHLAKREHAKMFVLHDTHVSSSGLGRPDLAPSSDVIERRRREAHETMDNHLEHLSLASDRVERILRVHSYDRHEPAEAIVEAVRDHGIDLVVMGTHGRGGMERVVLGSTTYRVLHRIPCPVLTVRSPLQEEG